MIPEYLISILPGLLKWHPQLLLFAARAYRKKAVTLRISCCHCSPLLPPLSVKSWNKTADTSSYKQSNTSAIPLIFSGCRENEWLTVYLWFTQFYLSWSELKLHLSQTSDFPKQKVSPWTLLSTSQKSLNIKLSFVYSVEIHCASS